MSEQDQDQRERMRRGALRSADVGARDEAAAGVPGRQSLSAQLPAGTNGPYVGSVFGGSALPASLQHQFEGSLGVDLSGVRVHTGDESARSARSVSARAYAIGQDIHFGAGQYDPSSARGQRLLAHEVAHTVQQRGAPTAQFKLEVTSPGDGCEREADSAAAAMVAGRSFRVTSTATAIARTPEDEAHADDHAGEPAAEDRAIDTRRVDASRADRDRLRGFIERLDTLPAARAQLEIMRAASAGERSVIELVYVHMAGTHDGVRIAAGDLDALVQLAETRVAELQVAGDGASFAGLAERGVSADVIAALTGLGNRYMFGGGGGGGLDRIAADQEELARLASGLPALDPMSAASLRQIGTWMRQAFAATQAELGPTIREDAGGGESLEEHDARIQRYLEAGDHIRNGLFAGLFFSVTLMRSGDTDAAARSAAAGAALDGLISAFGSVAEGRYAARESPERDSSGRVTGEPTIVGVGDPPSRPEPVRAPVPVDMTAPRGETRMGRRARERSTMAGHARRFAATRR